MRTRQGRKFFKRRMQAFDGNVIVSLAQLDVLLDQNRRLKAQIEEMEDREVEQLKNQDTEKDILDYQFLVRTNDKKGEHQEFSGRLTSMWSVLPTNTIQFQILDERICKFVVDQKRETQS